jgi:hypothetical protein
MDFDEEEEQMFVELFEEEMAAAAQDEEHMLILTCLSGLYAESAGTRSPEVQVEAANGGLLYALRRLLRR